MVTAKIRKTAFGYDYMKAENHAGDPIICASVSAIMQGLCSTLMNIEPKPDITRMKITEGFVEVGIAPMIKNSDQAVIDAVFTFALVSIAQIAKHYPQNVELFTEYC